MNPLAHRTNPAPDAVICTGSAQARSCRCPKCGKTFVGHNNIGFHAKKCGVSWQALFWDKVDKSDPAGCWPWKGARHAQGYGAFRVGSKYHRSSRLAYELVKGHIQSGLDVLHKCDNPPCCNPDHLFLGTDKDNAADRRRKGRRGHKYMPVDQLLHPHLSRRR
jgi:hypothetical protein